MREDYIRTARAKGLRERRVVLRHGVRSRSRRSSRSSASTSASCSAARSSPRPSSTSPGSAGWPTTRSSSSDLPMIQGTVLVRRVLHHHREPGRRHPVRVPRPAGAVLVSVPWPLLEVKDLRVHFDDRGRRREGRRRRLATRSSRAGRSASSASPARARASRSLTVMGLTRARNARDLAARSCSTGSDLLTASDDELREIRGNDIAMIFQDPLSSLHPFYKVGDQLVEAVRAHRDVSKAQARDRAVELLEPGRHPRAAQRARRRLPARVLRRHAPARDDRDGARQRPEAADRRRADDGARRDRAGADPRADRSACSTSSTRRS